MPTSRLEAFSDGVIAIIITIMVLELKMPEGNNFLALKEIIHPFIGYVLSFIYVGIYWNNHHHLMHITTRVSGSILWLNLILLFALSLIPISTSWWGAHFNNPVPTLLYGIILLLCAAAYYTLQSAIIRLEGKESILKKSIGKDWKTKLSLISYLVAVGIALYCPKVSETIYLFVALIWLIPDKRIEKEVVKCNEKDS